LGTFQTEKKGKAMEKLQKDGSEKYGQTKDLRKGKTEGKVTTTYYSGLGGRRSLHTTGKGGNNPLPLFWVGAVMFSSSGGGRKKKGVFSRKIHRGRGSMASAGALRGPRPGKKLVGKVKDFVVLMIWGGHPQAGKGERSARKGGEGRQAYQNEIEVSVCAQGGLNGYGRWFLFAAI